MKKMLIRSIVIASFAVVAGLPVLANLAPPAPRPPAQIQLADASPSTADRNAYAQKARADLQVWRVKLDQFGESVKTESKAARATASEDLNAAWTKAKDASAKLETARAQDWESAKASFEQASDALSAKWAKVRADVK